eukprot:3796200-Prymnesium_polylepis.1
MRTLRLAATAVVLSAGCFATAVASATGGCPTPRELEDEIARGATDRLVDYLWSCSRLAESQRKLISAAHSVLSAADFVGGGDGNAPREGQQQRHASDGTPPPPPGDRGTSAATASTSDGTAGGGSATKGSRPRQKLATWHESEEEQRIAQSAQADVIRRRARTRRPRELVRSRSAHERRVWSVPCDLTLYRLGLPPVAGCTPTQQGATAIGGAGAAGGAAGDAAGLCGCGRVLRDDFLTRAEQLLLISLVQRSMRGMYHQGGQTSFAPGAASAPRHMGAAGVALFADTMRRVMGAIQADFGMPQVWDVRLAPPRGAVAPCGMRSGVRVPPGTRRACYMFCTIRATECAACHAAVCACVCAVRAQLFSAGALFTRIWSDELTPADGMDVDPGHRYWNAHVDKANRASYDYSALLYLNSHCAAADGAACDYLDTEQVAAPHARTSMHNMPHTHAHAHAHAMHAHACAVRTQALTASPHARRAANAARLRAPSHALTRHIAPSRRPPCARAARPLHAAG